MDDNNKIVCSNIWKLFGPDEKRVKENLDPNLSIKKFKKKRDMLLRLKMLVFLSKKVKLSLLWAYQEVENQHW